MSPGEHNVSVCYRVTFKLGSISCYCLLLGSLIFNQYFCDHAMTGACYCRHPLGNVCPEKFAFL